MATNFHPNLFADDTVLSKSDKDLNNLILTCNEELEKASQWFKANKLSLNISKTKYIIFRHSNMPLLEIMPSLKINNIEIERIGSGCNSQTIKFVGLSLDEYLTWEHHANSVGNKIACSIYSIKQWRNLFPMKVLDLLYKALVKPHLEYGLLAWGMANKRYLNKITVIQKKAIRCCTKSNYNAHADPLYAKLKTLKLSDLFHLKIGEFMSKAMIKKHPCSIQVDFNLLSSTRSRNFKQEVSKLKCLDHFPKSLFPKIWNRFPIDLREKEGPKRFKKAFKEMKISNYQNFNCTKRKCFPCKKK